MASLSLGRADAGRFLRSRPSVFRADQRRAQRRPSRIRGAHAKQPVRPGLRFTENKRRQVVHQGRSLRLVSQPRNCARNRPRGPERPHEFQIFPAVFWPVAPSPLVVVPGAMVRTGVLPPFFGQEQGLDGLRVEMVLAAESRADTATLKYILCATTPAW